MSSSVDGDNTKPSPEGTATAAGGPSTEAATATAATISASSSTSSFPNVKVAVVTTKRKEELLLKARAERRHWIEKVPLPYVAGTLHERQISGTGGSSAGNNNSLGNDLWAVSSVSTTSNDGSSLYKVKSSVVCQKYLPTAPNVISELYGLPTVSTTANNAKSPVEPACGPLGLMQVAERVETLVSDEMDLENLL